MRIAQVAPLMESVPPRLYGGTERIVGYLCESLVGLGHDVTLFASADSRTSARLVPCCPRSLRDNPDCTDSMAHHVAMLEQVLRRQHEFDIIHYHIDYLHFPLSARSSTPTVTTLHGRLDLPDLQPLYQLFQNIPVVSISNDQRTPLPFAGWVRTIYHGIPPDLYQFQPNPGGYLAFVGRISPEKGLDRAIHAARRANVPLRIAAKVDRTDKAYFESEIKPLLEGDGVEFIGEISDSDKNQFLGEALALLFLIDWPEPFGLAMIEAMACGTPVITARRGATPEVVDHGLTGFIVDDPDQAVDAIRNAHTLDRAAIRKTFEQRFTADRMADDYLAVYQSIIDSANDVALLNVQK